MMANPLPTYSEIDPAKFEVITPLQFTPFRVPNTLNHRQLLDDEELRVAVCDSPLANAGDEFPLIAAMIVPKGRERDWNYITEFGQMQLLFKFRSVSRLILIGNLGPDSAPVIYKRPPATDPVEQQGLEIELKALLLPLHPKVSFTSNNGLPETLFLTNEHDMAYRVTSNYYLCRIVGAMLVEDVELVGNQQLRRRMRFRRMPDLIQSEAILVPIIGDDEAIIQTDLESLTNMVNVQFEADTSVLVHQYLIPMVSGLLLIASYLNLLSTPRALCLGVGGGVLLNFLDTQLNFEVTGVELDRTVLTAAKHLFGLNKTGSIRLIVGDAIETIQNFPPREPNPEDTDVAMGDKFDVVFVDLYSEAEYGFSAPPPEFVKKPVFECLKSLLDNDGVLIMNVIPWNQLFSTTLVQELKEVFHRVYKIDVENEDHFVVMAIVYPIPAAGSENKFLKKLKSVIPGTYLDSIVQL